MRHLEEVTVGSNQAWSSTCSSANCATWHGRSAIGDGGMEANMRCIVGVSYTACDNQMEKSKDSHVRRHRPALLPTPPPPASPQHQRGPHPAVPQYALLHCCRCCHCLQHDELTRNLQSLTKDCTDCSSTAHGGQGGRPHRQAPSGSTCAVVQAELGAAPGASLGPPLLHLRLPVVHHSVPAIVRPESLWLWTSKVSLDRIFRMAPRCSISDFQSSTTVSLQCHSNQVSSGTLVWRQKKEAVLGTALCISASQLSTSVFQHHHVFHGAGSSRGDYSHPQRHESAFNARCAEDVRRRHPPACCLQSHLCLLWCRLPAAAPGNRAASAAACGCKAALAAARLDRSRSAVRSFNRRCCEHLSVRTCRALCRNSLPYKNSTKQLAHGEICRNLRGAKADRRVPTRLPGEAEGDAADEDYCRHCDDLACIGAKTCSV